MAADDDVLVFHNVADEAVARAEVENLLATCRTNNSHFLTLRRQNCKLLPRRYFLDLPLLLSEIDLSWNFLESLPSSIWQIASLRRLCLRGNQLTELWNQCDESDAASTSSISESKPGLANLEFLDLSENYLTSIPNSLLQISPALTTLLLDVNKLERLPEIPPSHIATSAKLVTFSASNNSIAEFPCGFLASSSSSLRTLTLSDNKIPFVPDEFACESLQTFQLGNNTLASFPISLFRLSGLVTISLFRAGILEIPALIGRLQNLERLDVSFNSIRSLPAQEIMALPKLSSLDLRGNDFDRLDLSQEFITRFGDGLLIEGDTPDEILPGVWLGSYNAAKNKFWLRRNNVTHILTIAKGLDDVPDEKDGFNKLLIEIEDLPDESLKNHLDQCMKFIYMAVEKNQGVLVHCVAGVSRSATVVAAYVALQDRSTAQEALAKVKAKRPGINPNDGFRRQLEEYAEANLRKPEKSRRCTIC